MIISKLELNNFVKKNKKFTIPPASTYGDLFLHIFLNFGVLEKGDVKVLIFNEPLSLSISKAFKPEYFLIYKNLFYSIFVNFLNLYNLKNIRKQYETRIYKFLYRYSCSPPFDDASELIEYTNSKNCKSRTDFIDAFEKYANGRSRFLLMRNLSSSHKVIQYQSSTVDSLLNSLQIKNKKYCVMHLKIAKANTDPRGVPSLEPFKKLIKKILDDGITPVIIGTHRDYSHNMWDNFPGVLKYYQSPLQSPLNDSILFSGCEFYIGTPSGPSVHAYLTGKPALVLDALPLADWHGAPNHYFYPKTIYKASGDRLTLNEIILSPIYFEMAPNLYHANKYILGNLDDHEILKAYSDFSKAICGIYSSEEEDCYSYLQTLLNPMHLGVYKNPKMLLYSYVKKNLKVDH